MKKQFLKLNDEELKAKLDKCNYKILEYQKIIDDYDKHYENFQKNKLIDNNPIILNDILNLKINSDGTTSYVKIKDSHVQEIENNKYLLNKEGNRFFYSEKMDYFVKNGRQIELILRSRKRETEQSEMLGYVYVLSNKSLSQNIYKIGSTYGDPDKRAEELTGTGHLHPFRVEEKIKIKSAEYYEKKIHSLLGNYRVKKNREFFELDLDKIKSCLKDIYKITDKGEKKLSLADLKKEIKV